MPAKYSVNAPPGLKLCPICECLKSLEDFTLAKKNTDGRGTYCKPCRAIHQKSWREANPDRRQVYAERSKARFQTYAATRRDELAAKSRAYYAANRTAVSARAAAYRRAHPDKYLEYVARVGDRLRATSRAWKALNVNRVQEYQRAYWRSNGDRFRELHRQWCKAHPESQRANARNQKARRKGAMRGSKVDYSFVLRRDRWICGLCGKKVENRKELHFDHITPLSKQGAHADWNIQVSHKLCNLRKGNKLIGQPRLPI